MSKTIGDRIRERRIQLGMSQEELAAKVGYESKSTINKIESGVNTKRGLNQSKIKAFADALKTTPSFIMGWTDDSDSIYKESGIDFFRIPLYTPLCCGNGGFNEDNIIEYVPVPSKGLSSPDRYFAQEAIGESMKDAGISSGDLLIFEKTNSVDSGVIGCFCIDENEAMCKKYSVKNGIIMLMPMNSDFEPIIVDPLDECFKCLGKLKKIIKDVK